MVKNPFEDQKTEKQVSVGAPSDLPVMPDASTEEKKQREDYLATLEDFAKNPLPGSPAWESRLRAQIKSRIEKGPEKGYLMGMRQAATSLDSEKERILTAVIMYELENLEGVKDIVGYNKTMIVRLALDVINEGKQLGSSVRQIIDKKSLDEISSYFIGIPHGNRNSGDLGKLASIALERRETETETSERILHLVKTDISKDFSGIYGIALDLKKYSSNVFDVALGEILVENPSKLEFYFARMHDYLNNLQGLDNWQINQRKKEADEIFKYSSVLKNSYEAFVQGKREKIEREGQEKMEQQQREQQAREEQLQRDQQEKEIRKKEQLLKDQERLDNYVDAWVEKMEPGLIKADLNADDVIRIGRNGEIELLNKKNFPILKVEGDFYSVDFLNRRQRELSMGYIFGESAYGYGEARLGEDRLVKLSNVVKGKMNDLENINYPNSEDIYKKISDSIGIEEENITAKDFEEKISRISDVLNKISVIDADERYKQILEAVSFRLVEYKNGLESKLSEMLDSQTEIEKRESIEELKREYLLNQIESQIDYLRELYSQESGLLLDNAMGEASADNGSSVGSVGIGLRQSMKLEQRLELKLEILPRNDYIELEMGDSIESIKNRAAMVNWVAPHEIAHLVDWSKEQKDKAKILADKKSSIEGLLKEIKGPNKENFVAAIRQNSSECIIDGIGFKMAKEYGTANPFEGQETERISTILNGFCASLNVLEIIAKDKENQDLEARAWIATALYRMIAVGQKLLDEAVEKDADPDVIEKAEERIIDLGAIFERINGELKLISGKENTKKLLDLFGELFEAGKEMKL